MHAQNETRHGGRTERTDSDSGIEEPGDSDETTEFWLRNSIVTTERGPVGTLLKIERFSDRFEVDYAGPVDYDTLRALEEVSWYVE